MSDSIHIDYHMDSDTSLHVDDYDSGYATLNIADGVAAYSGVTLYFRTSEQARLMAQALRKLEDSLLDQEMKRMGR